MPKTNHCLCGHLWDEHEKPEEGVPWDICSFPCEKCSCFEYEEANPLAGKGGAE